jgi:hypothetical protein
MKTYLSQRNARHTARSSLRDYLIIYHGLRGILQGRRRKKEQKAKAAHDLVKTQIRAKASVEKTRLRLQAAKEKRETATRKSSPVRRIGTVKEAVAKSNTVKELRSALKAQSIRAASRSYFPDRATKNERKKTADKMWQARRLGYMRIRGPAKKEFIPRYVEAKPEMFKKLVAKRRAKHLIRKLTNIHHEKVLTKWSKKRSTLGYKLKRGIQRSIPGAGVRYLSRKVKAFSKKLSKPKNE